MLVLGLITTQIFWVNKAYFLVKQQFEYSVETALRTVAKQILVHNNDSTLVYNQVERLDFGTYRVNINDTLHPDIDDMVNYYL